MPASNEEPQLPRSFLVLVQQVLSDLGSDRHVPLSWYEVV